ncbi:hypothetical protein AFUB_002860 [Aspergillus fumigatus A1163]|uniref:Uncharacterized protein n=1 Tax=Aspergillus fumigatus (strain CBS 144.89 / FGSC A1163 / CEA10) TaxID=451804 RepID=B0XMI6_ASPFC|nr:hypothetical protein AFUB_002860 [Aspergillus fumigatus A1163]
MTPKSTQSRSPAAKTAAPCAHRFSLMTPVSMAISSSPSTSPSTVWRSSMRASMFSSSAGSPSSSSVGIGCFSLLATRGLLVFTPLIHPTLNLHHFLELHIDTVPPLMIWVEI